MFRSLIVGRRALLVTRRHYAMSADTYGIIPKLASISNLASFTMKPPQICVVGNQSSGKSSVLDALMGEDFLPKGDNMVTSRPIEVSLVQDSSRWGRVDGSRVMSIPEMKEYMKEENKDIEGVSDVPLRIELHSPDVYNLNLVDLPGYFVSVREGQDPALPKQIKKLCAKYLQDPQNLILCVVSSTADVATSVAIGQAKKFDEGQDRTLGVFTKIDKARNSVIQKVLSNEEYRLPLGYIGVRCRTYDEVQQGMSFNDLIKAEDKMIHQRRLHGLPIGLPYLRQKLSDLLLQRVIQYFPEIVAKIDQVIADKSRSSDLLTQLSKHKDLEQIAKKLESLVDHLHTNSPDRLELEIAIRRAIDELVIRRFVQLKKDMLGTDDETQIVQQEVQKLDTSKPKDYPFDQYKFHGKRWVYYDRESPRTEHPNSEIMGDLMIYGDNTPRNIDSNTMKELGENLFRLAVVSRHFYPFIPDNYRIDKHKWHKELGYQLTHMIDSGLAEESRQVVFGTLLSFVKTLGDPRDQNRELGRFFFEYLIGQVNSRTDNQQLAENISFMLRRELRPQIDHYTLTKKTWDFLDKHRVSLYQEGWFSFEMFDYKYPIYHNIWTMAYLEALQERVRDDIYRVFATNVINPLIFETLLNSLKLFKSSKILRAAQKQESEKKKLEEVKAEIERFQNSDCAVALSSVPAAKDEFFEHPIDPSEKAEVEPLAKKTRGRKKKVKTPAQ